MEEDTKGQERAKTTLMLNLYLFRNKLICDSSDWLIMISICNMCNIQNYKNFTVVLNLCKIVDFLVYT